MKGKTKEFKDLKFITAQNVNPIAKLSASLILRLIIMLEIGGEIWFKEQFWPIILFSLTQEQRGQRMTQMGSTEKQREEKQRQVAPSSPQTHSQPSGATTPPQNGADAWLV